MAYSSKVLAQLIEKYCTLRAIDRVVISPGSRNAPLIITFTNNPSFKTYSIVDERCAAFFALGMAQQTQKSVVIFCTSGSALLNYYPAVAEAFYSHIPLIVVSADRPSDKIDIADGQTIRQENVFDNHSLYNANLVETDDKFKYNALEIQKAITMAIQRKGPVHINIPFEEPLYNSVTASRTFDNLDFKIEKQKIISSLRESQKAIINWQASTKRMVLVGVHYPEDKLNNLLAHLSNDESVIVLTETTSNLHHPNFINAIDNLIFSLDDKRLEQLAPECLITLGGMVISKRIKQFLRQFKPQYHWHISELNAPDTYFCLSGKIALPDTMFFERLLDKNVQLEGEYKKLWLDRKAKVDAEHQDFIETVDFSDLSVFNTVVKTIPDNIILQLANSSVVRYAQLFSIDSSVQVFCNRGTSGIDGSTSTAIGAAHINDKQTVFITGDLSFFYDSNALWNNYIPSNFRIILINNGGGGIFRILPGPQSTEALDYFEVPHQLTAKQLCDMYHFEYTQVDNEMSLKMTLNSFYSESKQPKLLEITTPRELNDKVLRDYFKSLN